MSNVPAGKSDPTVATLRSNAHTIVKQHGSCLGISCYDCPLYDSNSIASWHCTNVNEYICKVGYMKEAVAYLFKTREQS